MNKKVIAGIILSIILVYLSIKGVDVRNSLHNLKNINLFYVAVFIIIVVFVQFLRSYRWGLILSPFQKIKQISLFSVTSVGFLAIAAFPARMGELARPYLIAQKSGIKFSSALGTIIVERVLDGLSILAIAMIMLLLTDLPSWMIKSSIIFAIFTLAILLCIIFLILRREAALKFINLILSKLPGKLAHKLDGLIHHLIDGFSIITNVKILFYILFLSFFIWLINSLAIYTLFMAFSFSLPLIAAIVVMVVLLVGIAIPTAPGYIGNWHFACILGLSIFSMSRPDAFSFALVYHFLSIAIVVFLGLTFLPFNKISFADMIKRLNKVERDEEIKKA
ncbi:MAG TPA: flippase-like domain-containing protein [Deltaproteobacteria bacterium]|nr:flippase-like domain-containing protein [Deltaproteobacteria bacterium]